MKKQESDDYINVSIVIIYAVMLLFLFLIFEWVRKCRKDSKKVHEPDAFEKLANCIGLSKMSKS